MATICLIYSTKPSASWPTQQLVSGIECLDKYRYCISLPESLPPNLVCSANAAAGIINRKKKKEESIQAENKI